MLNRWASERRRQPVWRTLTALLLALFAGAGCEFKNADFVMRDRPQFSEQRGDKEITYYLVHVGDSPTLAFRSKLFYCDYAIMHDTTTDDYEDCGPDLGGAFEWPYKFKEVSPTGDFTHLQVTAYTTMGKRDYMPYRGKIMELGVGNDPGDNEAAAADILVRVYQSRLEIPVDLGGKVPLWHAARLEMEGRGVRKRRILYSSEPGPRHFAVEGPDNLGRYKVIYEPTIEDIDVTGVTKVLLKVPDEDGHFHDFTTELGPPTGPMETASPTGPGSDEGLTPVSVLTVPHPRMWQGTQGAVPGGWRGWDGLCAGWA